MSGHSYKTSRRSCDGKQICPTYAAAKVALRRLSRHIKRRKGDPPLGIYHCKHCGNYHVGHERQHILEESDFIKERDL